MSRKAFIAVLTLVLVLSVGCQPPEPEAPAEAPKERVENVQLGVALADVPDFFQVASNDNGVIELAPKDPAVEGKLVVSATEAQTAGINLVAAMEEHKADLTAREAGVYKGQRELGGPLGTAFYSRGQWSEGGRTMEETVIFMVHPWGDRKLLISYDYPAGDDSSSRLMDQLFAVLGEVEPRAAPPPAADRAAGGGAGAAADRAAG
ncbi:MAG: hypothetical protein AAGF23_22965 [Acidobacteriota bacterium]